MNGYEEILNETEENCGFSMKNKRNIARISCSEWNVDEVHLLISTSAVPGRYLGTNTRETVT